MVQVEVKGRSEIPGGHTEAKPSMIIMVNSLPLAFSVFWKK